MIVIRSVYRQIPQQLVILEEEEAEPEIVWEQKETKYRGIRWVPARGKWNAGITVGYSGRTDLGDFDDEEEAAHRCCERVGRRRGREHVKKMEQRTEFRQRAHCP